MPSLLQTTAWALVALIAMEGWAAMLHRLLWHRAWWPMHRSHHQGRRGRWEANDALSLVHAPVAAGLWMLGLGQPDAPWAPCALGVGLGMSAFGGLYLLFHDGMVHQRLPLGWLAHTRPMQALLKAHQAHHDGGGPPYGFFLSPWFLARAQQKPKRRPSSAG